MRVRARSQWQGAIVLEQHERAFGRLLCSIPMTRVCERASGLCFIDEGALEKAHRELGDQDAAYRLMRDEAAPTIRTSPGQHLNRYADLLLVRFRNPALSHRLIQIAADGSQKIGARWLVTLADNRAAGRSSPTILRAIAAWVLFVRGDRQAVDDPNAKMMAQTWMRANPDGVVNELLGPSGMFGEGLALSRDDRVEVRNLLPWCR
ncbi:hypothetical protein [Sphingomonas melonis]|uniref:mannitol dehydrogenase family protein n=2 Tax=Sphingomonadaceae TaxID=41297 RepID=UPI001E2C1CD3|nr:hypothetical protein [Sphingomonas melonis]